MILKNSDNKSIKFYHQPYPNYHNLKEIVFFSFIISVCVYLFLTVFQPFGTRDWTHSYKYLLLLPYSFITFIVFGIINFSFLNNKSWTLGKELIKLIFILFITSVFCCFYDVLIINNTYLKFQYFLDMLFFVFTIGTPIGTIYILSKFIYLKNKYEFMGIRIANKMHENPLVPSIEISEQKTFLIIAENKKIGLELNEDDFIYAASSDNYCIVYFMKDNTISKKFLRLTLTDLISQISTPYIKRCHRSYIINLRKVTDIKGNAQGYRLFVENVDQEVAVSRNYIDKIIPFLPVPV